MSFSVFNIQIPGLLSPWFCFYLYLEQQRMKVIWIENSVFSFWVSARFDYHSFCGYSQSIPFWTFSEDSLTSVYQWDHISIYLRTQHQLSFTTTTQSYNNLKNNIKNRELTTQSYKSIGYGIRSQLVVELPQPWSTIFLLFTNGISTIFSSGS